jgi:hypothetical protein
MVELSKRRRVVVDSDDDDDIDSFLQDSPSHEITIPVQKLDTPVKTFRNAPPKDAKFWVESNFSI